METTIFKSKGMRLNRLGKCPICEDSAELVEVHTDIDEEHHKECYNEYYTHWRGQSGVNYLAKKKNPKTRWT